MFEIKRLLQCDAEKLAKFQTQAFYDAYHTLHAKEDMDAYCSAAYTPATALADIIHKASDCYGAFDSASALHGYYILMHIPMPSIVTLPNRVFASELKRLYIAKSAYGTGLGNRLYNHALDIVQKRGVEGLWLNVSNRNYRAQTFYQDRGFNYAGNGPKLTVGNDILTSSYLTLKL
ncbi:N-acetyltransferase [Kordiimonas sp. SCSIO 12610]|uniref:GNAT family N-acetyltransferase n=1 Tax=Kordiimonas sp. SCSIO 12610 TaxID=2829597 RepID=UPI00210AC955|nr:GNAT family N-acetyltransferase [Kordiimonas sp. SCSIO 12610]UTW56712.1 GNAT family N-acetyltransferase [Kordiimonas sp. SCSIO 12610]